MHQNKELEQRWGATLWGAECLFISVWSGKVLSIPTAFSVT